MIFRHGGMAHIEEQEIYQKRMQIVDEISQYFKKSNNNWETLSHFLKTIVDTYTYQTLFSPAALYAPIFRRETAGHMHEDFHLAFFVLPPHFSGKPHSHSHINCVSAILHGSFTEITYQKNCEGDVFPIKTEHREKGSVVCDLVNLENEKFIHSVANFTSHNVHSLHVYGTQNGVDFNEYYEMAETLQQKSCL